MSVNLTKNAIRESASSVNLGYYGLKEPDAGKSF